MTSLNGVRKRRLTVKETSIANCEVLDEKHRIAVQGIFVGIIIKAGGASVKVTDLLFAFTFCKKQTRKTGVLAHWLFAFVFKDLCTENLEKLPRKILRQQKNRNFSILNSSAPSQNNKTSRTSCRRLFENFLPSTPTEITFEISLNLARS